MNKLTTLTGLTVALVLASGQSVLAMESGKKTKPESQPIEVCRTTKSGLRICRFYYKSEGITSIGSFLEHVVGAVSIEEEEKKSEKYPSKVVFRCEPNNKKCRKLLRELTEVAKEMKKQE